MRATKAIIEMAKRDFRLGLSLDAVKVKYGITDELDGEDLVEEDYGVYTNKGIVLPATVVEDDEYKYGYKYEGTEESKSENDGLREEIDTGCLKVAKDLLGHVANLTSSGFMTPKDLKMVAESLAKISSISAANKPKNVINNTFNLESIARQYLDVRSDC